MPTIDADVMVVAQGRARWPRPRGRETGRPPRILCHRPPPTAGGIGAAADEIAMGDSMAHRPGRRGRQRGHAGHAEPGGCGERHGAEEQGLPRVAALFCGRQRQVRQRLSSTCRWRRHSATSRCPTPSPAWTSWSPIPMPPAAAKRAISRRVGDGYRVRGLAGPQFSLRLGPEGGAHRHLHPAGADHAGSRLQHRLGPGDAGEGTRGARSRSSRTMAPRARRSCELSSASGASTGVFGTILGRGLSVCAIAGSIERIGGWLARISSTTLLFAGVVDFLSRLPAIVEFSQVASRRGDGAGAFLRGDALSGPRAARPRSGGGPAL